MQDLIHLRYNRVIILVDTDMDGHHVLNLVTSMRLFDEFPLFDDEFHLFDDEFHHIPFANEYSNEIKNNLYTGKATFKVMSKLNNRDCTICQEIIKCNRNSTVSIGCCGHAYHPECINTWIDSRHYNGCPECRNKFETKCDIREMIGQYEKNQIEKELLRDNRKLTHRQMRLEARYRTKAHFGKQNRR